MKSFYHFFEEADGANQQQGQRVSDDVFTVFGRHQPPHIGHKLGFDHASKLAGSIGDKAPADQRFYTSRTQDPKKNPLPFEMKTQFLQKMFPEHADKWDSDNRVKTVLGAATKAHDDGYKNFHFVGGSDRQQEMEDLLRRYNGNLYDFDNIYAHSAGDRDMTGLGENPLQNLSASKMRKFALGGDRDGFMEGLLLNDSFREKDADELFNALRTFMQKNEAWEVDTKNHELIRELYKDHDYFQVGEIVESISSGLVGRVKRCGTNHLICVTEDGIMFKNFVHDVFHK